MKSVIALLIGASAVKLGDGPAFFNEPTWGETFPSAAGFVQISACSNSGVVGVTCRPSNSQLFATGMNGDEDLGEDITMKGEKFHYQQILGQTKAKDGDEAAAGEDAAAVAEEKAEKKGEATAKEAEKSAAKGESNKPAEKVSVIETAIAKQHTTFYAEN